MRVERLKLLKSVMKVSTTSTLIYIENNTNIIHSHPYIFSTVRMEQLQQSLCSVLIVLAFSFVPFVDWAAHLGGVICGFTTGFLCFAPWIKTRHCAVFWFSIGIVLNVVVYGCTLSYLYSKH